MLDYLNWYIEFYAPNKEQQTQQVITGNMLSGYLVTIPAQDSLGSTIAKYNYFFWNNGKPLVVLAQQNSDVIKAIINSIEIN